MWGRSWPWRRAGAAAEVREASPGAGCPALIAAGGDGDVALCHADLLAAARRLIERFRFRPGETCVGLLPLDCCAGFVAMGLVTLLIGGTVWWGAGGTPRRGAGGWPGGPPASRLNAAGMY